MPTTMQLLFLPGASGNTKFWKPLADQLAHPGQRCFVRYPGFGQMEPDASITCLEDLCCQIAVKIDRPTAIFAQSMGGILAIRLAMQFPSLITHLVLSVTSGGIDMRQFDAADWRSDFGTENPQLPSWFLHDNSNLQPDLATLRQPTLLLWGDADPISPVAVGEYLRQQIPNAVLHIVAGGQHDLALVHAASLAPLVDHHLTKWQA
ncbi:alpha/beta hydrolase [Laribacter hongkongensis]|uniref:alpha/beta fold hydrolase n=1 Tax=Laribacter hongkongensis TaxID=168471 RepID=UPI001EFDABE3|nr:alpha/beta fold hydrolase [Laribacter hongkongensis]MCG9063928.1 alpha/beta hydrolase [Laribacter hongkongensis]